MSGASTHAHSRLSSYPPSPITLRGLQGAEAASSWTGCCFPSSHTQEPPPPSLWSSVCRPDTGHKGSGWPHEEAVTNQGAGGAASISSQTGSLGCPGHYLRLHNCPYEGARALLQEAGIPALGHAGLCLTSLSLAFLVRTMKDKAFLEELALRPNQVRMTQCQAARRRALLHARSSESSDVHTAAVVEVGAGMVFEQDR